MQTGDIQPVCVWVLLDIICKIWGLGYKLHKGEVKVVSSTHSPAEYIKLVMYYIAGLAWVIMSPYVLPHSLPSASLIIAAMLLSYHCTAARVCVCLLTGAMVLAPSHPDVSPPVFYTATKTQVVNSVGVPLVIDITVCK